jgi:hypothetical protein
MKKLEIKFLICRFIFLLKNKTKSQKKKLGENLLPKVFLLAQRRLSLKNFSF